MIICLFGTTYRKGYDASLEGELDALLHEELRQLGGFVSLHVYKASDGELLGVVRFETRAALESWRDNAVHRSVWRHAPALYDSFWIQNADTYREYRWTIDAGRTEGSLAGHFAEHQSNLVKRQL